MTLVPLLFIRYIFCMNNEIQTRRGKIKKKTSTATMEEKKTLNRFFFNFDY